jgi:hypothetical protein
VGRELLPVSWADLISDLISLISWRMAEELPPRTVVREACRGKRRSSPRKAVHNKWYKLDSVAPRNMYTNGTDSSSAFLVPQTCQQRVADRLGAASSSVVLAGSACSS